MIVEHAELSILPGNEAEFEAAFPRAQAVIAQADGFRWIEVHRGIERPSTYLLRIAWDSVDDHMVGFRESERYTEWRAIIGPFFAEPAKVEHFASGDGSGEK